MKLNKVDLEVKKLLLRYPTLFHNRFDAMVNILTTNNYFWENGCLVEQYVNEKFPTKQEMIDKCQKNLENKVIECNEIKAEYLDNLHSGFITTESFKLTRAKFIAEHIDIFSTEYTCVDYHETWLWLLKCHHDQSFTDKYWVINNKPQIVDDDWRKAIQDWLCLLLPNINQLFGTYNPKTNEPWRAKKEYEGIFNWVHNTLENYKTKEDKEKEEEGNRIAKELIDEILAKRN